MYAAGLTLFIVLAALGARIYAPAWNLVAISVVWSLFVSSLYLRMDRPERIGPYRAFFFLSLAVFFLIGMHGRPGGEAGLQPVCHLGLAGNILHVAYNQFLSAAGGNYLRYGILSAGIIWLAVILVSGPGFCGWICFFGGVDDSLSRLLRRPLFRVPGGAKVRRFQLGLLLFLAVFSFLEFESLFCKWACPFKVESSILNRADAAFVFQVAVYVSVGILALVLLPILTKQRTFCSAVCPFGAIPPLLGPLRPYRLRIDSKRCSDCAKCVDVCPSFAMTKTRGGVAAGSYCTLCMRCAESCPAGAISPVPSAGKPGRLPVFVSILFGGALALFYVPGGILAIWRLLSGGGT